MVIGFDPVLGRSVQRSFTVHGDPAFAQRRRRELVRDYGVTRVAITVAGAQLTVAGVRRFDAHRLDLGR